MNKEKPKVSVIIPTFNASGFIERQLTSLQNQTIKNVEIIVIDSSSQDGTQENAKALGAEVEIIPREAFDHGATRTRGGEKAQGEILVYLTQDALPADENAIENLIKPLYEDEKVGASFGRQRPFPDATPFGAHLRLFNYPDKSYIRRLEDKKNYGIKTAFLSNSFAGYRRNALDEIGWFEENLIFGEDTHAGAKLLQAGYQIAYAADAVVFHSHNHTVFREFKRYFDVGVFHRREHWILDTFGKPSGEGLKYLVSEMKYLSKNKKLLSIPKSMMRNMLKYIAYNLGYNYNGLPRFIVKRLSLNKDWWNRKAGDR